MSKQLLFPFPMYVVKISPNGIQERLKYGQYEAVMITKENGYPVDRTKILIPPTHPVIEVECENGDRLIFEKPFYKIEI